MSPLVLSLLVVAAVPGAAGDSDGNGGTAAPHRTMPADRRGWTKLGVAPPDLLLETVWAVEQLNQESLLAELRAVSEPGSPRYRQPWLDKDAARDLTANPSAARAVRTFLEAAPGCDVVAVTGRGEFVRARAPVAVWATMLDAEFHLFEEPPATAAGVAAAGPPHLGTAPPLPKVVARAEAYSLPESLQGSVAFVHGVAALPARATRLGSRSGSGVSAWEDTTAVFGHGGQAGRSDGDSAAAVGQTPVPQGPIYATPSFLREYYDIGTANGSAAAPIALYESGANYYSALDLAKFQTAVGLPLQPAVDVFGTGENATACAVAGANECGEPNLDVQTAAGLVVGSEVRVYHYNTSDCVGFLWFLQDALDTPDFPLVASISYDCAEAVVDPDLLASFNLAAAKLAASGHTLVVSAGDSGANSVNATGSVLEMGPMWPASCPYVLAVGATQIVSGAEVGEETNQMGSVITSGGGFSQVYNASSFQADAVSTFLGAGAFYGEGFFPYAGNRAYPDVANLGHDYPVIINGALDFFDGTSAAAPVVASIITLVNAQLLAADIAPIGFFHPTLYSTGVAAIVAKDVTAGSNGCLRSSQTCIADWAMCAKSYYMATEGWDAMTGWGSLHFGNLSHFYSVSAPLTPALTTCRGTGVDTAELCALQCTYNYYFGGYRFDTFTGKHTCTCFVSSSSSTSSLDDNGDDGSGYVICSDFAAPGVIAGLSVTAAVLVAAAVVLAVVFVRRKAAMRRRIGGGGGGVGKPSTARTEGLLDGGDEA